MRHLAGGELEIEIQGADRLDELGDMARTLIVFRSNAQELKAALEKERELNGLQRQFVSMVSHEFRTPLAIIDGNSQRLLRRPEKATPQSMTKALTKIRTCVRRLTELMESVLSAARLEDGRIKFEPVECDLNAVVIEVCSNYMELSQSHELVVSVDDQLGVIVADEKLLRQVISNLVSNAIKYSPAGKRVWVSTSAYQDGEIIVTVRDEGVGIPEIEQQKLFERFFRASTSTGIAGSGIGLHLAQHLAKMHKGVIEFDSVVGQGTSFCLRLPIARPRNTEETLTGESNHGVDRIPQLISAEQHTAA
ncbi:MAG: HAMP domain-containing histidine kinase [Rhizobiales bacterium]|nr:HAMP domain-containing histidine kinase [Hyphomicrobiales bacterium]